MEASEGAGPCTKFGSNTGDVESASALESGREPVPALRPETGPASAPAQALLPGQTLGWASSIPASAAAPTLGPAPPLQHLQLQPLTSSHTSSSPRARSLAQEGKFFLLFSCISSLVLYFMCSSSNSMTISPEIVLNYTIQQH